MATIEAEYLYIIQPCSAVESNRNLFKFGMSAKDPIKYRLTHYEKGCRIWFIIIMNDAYTAEQDLLRIFRVKFISRTEKGKEYFEVENIEDMINEIITYRAQHFNNIYIPNEDGLDGARCFIDSKDRIIRDGGNIKFIRSCDINVDFAHWLEAETWKYDTRSRKYWLTNVEYDAFIKKIDALHPTERPDEQMHEPERSEAFNAKPERPDEPIHEPERAEAFTASPSSPEQRPNARNTDNNTTHRNDSSALPPLHQQRIQAIPPPTNSKLVTLSVEKLVPVLEPYFKRHNISPRSASAKLDISLTTKPDIILINHIKIYQRNKLILDAPDLTVIYDQSSIYDLKSLHLSNTKLEALNKVKTNTMNEYILYIPTFEMKKFRRRGSRNYIPYLVCEFINKDEDQSDT